MKVNKKQINSLLMCDVWIYNNQHFNLSKNEISVQLLMCSNMLIIVPKRLV